MKQTRNLWPFGIILTFAIFISGTISLVVMACSHKMDLVSADYYEQEINFQNHIDQLYRTQRLARDASVAYDPATRRIQIALSLNRGAPVSVTGESRSDHDPKAAFEKEVVPGNPGFQAITGHIQLYRPSAAGLDRRIKLEPNAQGIQFLDAAGLQRGLWKVRVSWKVNDQEYFLDQMITVAGT